MTSQEFTIIDVKFSNATSGFHVLLCKNKEGTNTRVVGSFPGVKLAKGLKISCRGITEKHPTYGDQFTASVLDIVPDKGKVGLILYLSNNVKSIGPITASRLYDIFGDNLVSILNDTPETIREAPFLSTAQADAIIKEWASSNNNRNLSIFLSDMGLTSYQIKNVLSFVGLGSLELIKSNPYTLMGVPGIGFITVDKVAKRLGIGADDPRRVESIVLHSISDLCLSEGHTYVLSSQIRDHIIQRVFKRQKVEHFTYGEYISDSDYFASIARLKSDGKIIADGDRLYMPHLYHDECSVASLLAETLIENPFDFGDIGHKIKEYEANNSIVFSDDQRKTFELLNSSRSLTITGYPGTGKTTLISALTSLFDDMKLSYTLLSPTGIAAKRLSQVTGKPASTIHRALGYHADGTWEFGKHNKYSVDAVIVDEMSMVDINTMARLMESLPAKTIKIFVGDAAQLPSVGPGYVLHNLSQSNKMPSVGLRRIYRQGRTSDIISLAHSILNNQDIGLSFDPKSEVVKISLRQEDVVDEIKKLCQRLKLNNKNFQVIAPMYDGDLGVNNLNNELRGTLNPDVVVKKSVHVRSGETDLYEGDRVMVIKNDYERGVYNGDAGKITRIDIKQDLVEVKIFGFFDPSNSISKYVDKLITFKIEEARTMLKVAFAVTAHKVQGQEFDYVVLPMTMQYNNMLYKNLVYTAITRAKSKVFIMGNLNAFEVAARTDRDISRNSYLWDRIDQSYDLAEIRNVATS